MKKINLLFISGISALIIFLILTVVQSKLSGGEEIQAVYISTKDIARDMEITKKDFKEIFVPVSLIENTEVVKCSEDLYGKYTKESINKGQIIFRQDIGTKEELRIVEAEDGLEKIAIKIKASENAVAYQVKPKDRIHLYFTGKSAAVKSIFIRYGVPIEDDKTDNLLLTSKIVEDIEVLGIYDELGRGYDNSNFSKLDTIVIAVEPGIAKMINNLRSQGTFDITR